MLLLAYYSTLFCTLITCLIYLVVFTSSSCLVDYLQLDNSKIRQIKYKYTYTKK